MEAQSWVILFPDQNNVVTEHERFTRECKNLGICGCRGLLRQLFKVFSTTCGALVFV